MTPPSDLLVGTTAPASPAVDPVKVLRAAFKPKRIPLALLSRMAAAGVSPALAGELATCATFRGAKDVAGLITLRSHEVPDQDIVAWSKWGSLDPAWRLSSLGVSAAQAGPTILRCPGASTAGYLRVVQAASALGVRVEEVPFWVSAGVFSLTGPPVDEVLFSRWRSFGVNWVGMRQAALVAAAGMDIAEAIGLHQRGEFDGAVIKIMAELNL